MKTSISSCLVAATLLLSSSASVADQESHRKAGEELLKTMHMDTQLLSSIDQMLDNEVKSNPQIAPLRDVRKKFLSKYVSWESLQDEVVKVYTDTFTEEEIKQISAFYRTPAGMKMIEKMPELMAKGMQIGANRVQSNQSELIRMLTEEKTRNQRPE